MSAIDSMLSLRGKSIVKPVGEVICIRKFPNSSDDTLTNQMLVCNVDDTAEH